MKISVLQKDLNRGLANVSRVVATRGQLPVLANVLLEAEKDGLKLAATNLEMGIREWVGGKIEVEGRLTVPAKSLSEFVGSLGGEVVGLEAEGDKLKVRCGKYTATFAGIDASEFPVMPKSGLTPAKAKEGHGIIEIGSKLVLDIAMQVAYAAASDESRPVFTGVRFAVAGDQLAVTATDGFRLARKKIQDKGFKDMGSLDGLVLPARTILELARMADGSAEKNMRIEVFSDNNQVIFGVGRSDLISRVLGGNYPEVDKIIPSEHKTRVIVERGDLINAVRAVGIFARENNNIIKFTIINSQFLISARASQAGESNVEIEAEMEGEDGEIAFNYKYVMDYLNSTASERVVLEMNGNLAPGVWRGEKDESLLALVMPVRV